MDTEEKQASTEQRQNETLKGESEKKEFQAETRMLLDIVARSLYSDKEVSWFRKHHDSQKYHFRNFT